MTHATFLWTATVFQHGNKIFIWLNPKGASRPPGTVEILDHLTQRAGESEPRFYHRVNQFARLQAARSGAEISVTLEPEDAPSPS